MPTIFSSSQAVTMRLEFFIIPSMHARSPRGLRSARVDSCNGPMKWSVETGAFTLYVRLMSFLGGLDVSEKFQDKAGRDSQIERSWVMGGDLRLSLIIVQHF